MDAQPSSPGGSETSPRRRLVVCCDGTWNAPDSPHVTNIEKIARTVQNDLEHLDGVQQLVHYIAGVGSHGFRADRILGGAFGLGLESNVLDGYRFLALNYDPGDEIYLFGFSRGAYTARSLAGMIAKVGLLTADALVEDKLGEAEQHYRDPDPNADAEVKAFTHENCHPETRIHFLGVFDTVGALGVPGLLPRVVGGAHPFHDVRLSDYVLCARQALAIDELRTKFEPSLWEADDEKRRAAEESGRVRQVWFSGVHSDVGGGYPESGLADTTLLWMITEARARGLVFDDELLDRYVDSGHADTLNTSLSTTFKVLNAVSGTRRRLKGDQREFIGDHRRMDPPPNQEGERAVGVSTASTTAVRYRSEDGYRPVNLVEFDRETDDFTGRITDVVRLPRQRDGSA